MHDWAAPIVAAALFAFLAPGLVFQMPGNESPIGFMNMKTSVISMLLHAVLYGLFLILLLVILDIHIYAQQAPLTAIVLYSSFSLLITTLVISLSLCNFYINPYSPFLFVYFLAMLRNNKLQSQITLRSPETKKKMFEQIHFFYHIYIREYRKYVPVTVAEKGRGL